MFDTSNYWLGFQCFFQGIMFFQIIFMFSQYVAVRRLEYLYNGLYLVCMSCYFLIATIEFINSEAIYKVDNTWTFRYFNVLTLLSYMMYYRFFRYFFDVATTMPTLLKLFYIVENTLLAYVPIHISLVLFQVSPKWHENVFMFFSVSLFSATVWVTIKIMGHRLNLGNQLVIAGSSIFALGSFADFISTRILKTANHEWSLIAGLLMEVMCLALALAYKNREIEKEKNSYQRMVLQNEMTALRSQMNPHFIFNCLNAVKSLVLQNEISVASAYISKFARLVRLVLENSRNEWITLEQELETLTLYLEIEQMRFNNRFQFWINFENDVDTEGVKLPPMLIQPYVENAIWHGLMHKDDTGNVTITISQKADNQLEINVIDDGVGRKKAMELRSKKAAQRKSLGMEISAERLSIINQIYKVNAQIIIHDLTDPKTNEALGTKVQLLLSV
jgi:Histidine kinase/7TM diverse intracellular signalling